MEMIQTSIMIVEDEGITSKDIELSLKNAGYNIVAMAFSGEQAMESVRNANPDLILMDIKLKGALDGISTAEKIRLQLDVPIIYLTAHQDATTIQRAKTTMPYGFLTKPFDEKELRIAIEMALYKHKAESAVRKMERWLAATLKSVGDGVIATDLAGIVTFMNPIASNLAGWVIADALGRDIADVLKLECDSRIVTFQSIIEKILAKNTLMYLDPNTILISRNGNRVPIWDSIAPIRAEDEKITGVIMVFRDVSEQKHLEQNLHHAQKMEAIGRLAGGVAHDFNNLLTAILGNCTFLRDSVPSGDSKQKEIEEIITCAERAAALTRQLLAFGKKQIVQPKVLNVNSILTNVSGLLSRLIGENIELSVSLAKDLWSVHMDPVQIEQIILNLAINARDAMPQGGKLTIETTNIAIDEAEAVLYQNTKHGPYVTLTVTDTGCGMEESVKARIFEPFYTTKSQGTGLGLSTVYGIVQQSGGNISVYSELGKGTIFKAYLPKSDGLPKSELLRRMSVGRSGGTETILLVEDESQVRKVTKRALENLGYTVHEATDGQNALVVYAELKRSNIDLLITDAIMPKIGGIELAKRLRSENPYLKVLFISGYSEGFAINQSIFDGKINFLQKPFSADDLASKVREVLDSSK